MSDATVLLTTAEPGDAAALSQAIANLLRDPALAARMGQKGKQRAQELFGLQRMINGLEALYEELGATAQTARARAARADV